MSIQKMPAELVSMIGRDLDDLSLSHLSQTCRHLNNALSVNAACWRAKWAREFDGGAGLPVEELGIKYKALKFFLRPSHRTSPEKRVVRSGQVHGGPSSIFQSGRTANEARVLAAVKLIIKDACTGRDSFDGQIRSHNFTKLGQFAQQYQLFTRLGQSNRPLRDTHDDLFLVQVMLVHELLAAPPNNIVYGIAEAQNIVYATEDRQPILKGPRKDIVNFKYLRSAINLLYSAMVTEIWDAQHEWPFDFLPDAQKPSPWCEKVQPGLQRIGTSWLGAWSSTLMAGDVVKIRRDPNHTSRENVENTMVETFEGLQLVYVDDEPERYALKDEIDRHIGSKSHPSKEYWQELANQMQDMKSTGMDINEADERALRDATRKAAAKRNKSNLWGFVSDFLTTVEMDKGKNPDIIEDMDNVQTETLMFKLACGRENMVGGAVAEDASLGIGYLQPLPSQRGVPGWMRITMLKFKWPVGRSATRNDVYPQFMSKHSNKFFWSIMASDIAMDDVPHDDGEARLQENTCWAYEGIVLPGGRFMAGRWWWINPDDPNGMRRSDSTQQSGPFMYWACAEDQSTVPAMQGWEEV